jgi:hypothetical protein
VRLKTLPIKQVAGKMTGERVKEKLTMTRRRRASKKAEGVPLVGLALSLCLMAAIAALAFVACAAL